MKCRISYWDRLIHVVEDDGENFDSYVEERFLIGENVGPGEGFVEFNSKAEAIRYVNANFKPEFIHEDFLTPNRFWKMASK